MVLILGILIYFIMAYFNNISVLKNPLSNRVDMPEEVVLALLASSAKRKRGWPKWWWKGIFQGSRDYCRSRSNRFALPCSPRQESGDM